MNATNHPNRSRDRSREVNLASSPTPQQVRDLRGDLGLTQAEAAARVFATERAWQNYEAALGTASARRMHPALWVLFQLMADRITLRDVRRFVGR